MTVLVIPHRRRSLRRAYRTLCKAVRGERVIGDRLLDVSVRGALVTCDEPVAIGERVDLTFRTPGLGPLVHAEAEITRVVHGYRDSDPGYCAGLRFLRLSRASHEELLVRLVGIPPPVPARRPPVDYAETVRRIAIGS